MGVRVFDKRDASRLDNGFRVFERIEVLVDHGLVDELPEAFGGLEFWRVVRQVRVSEPLASAALGYGDGATDRSTEDQSERPQRVEIEPGCSQGL